MDPVLFKAAEAGNIGPFENYQTCLDQLLTPDENTILHVYLGNQSREPELTDFVVIILEMCPPLLFQANKKGEIPLHLAAAYGHSNVVKVLIDRAKALPTDSESGVTEAKKMLRMTNEEQDTALHEAARHRRSHVVEILTKEDPEFPYSANVHGETPLYIAASIITRWREERGKVVDGILGNCISVDYGGPNGRTALNAAIRVRDDETARKLLEKEKKLTQTTDENGWSPLHHAACYDWSPRIVQVLLENDASAAYIAETEKRRTALHIAAIQGHVNAMKEIVSRCPACCELVDNRGWNALHYAVASKDRVAFVHCLKIPELARLGTKKDDKGNTPFHLIAALAHQQKQWQRVLFNDSYGYSGREIRCGLNKRQLSVDDIYEGNFAEIQKKLVKSLEDVGSGPIGRGPFVMKGEEEKNNEERNKGEEEALSKARESHLVVAALIATVTFAAAFTLPGGYKNDQGPNEGTAILAKKAAFIVFVISDAMSMVLSLLAVFIHFMISLIHGFKMVKDEAMDENTTGILFGYAMLLTMIAMGTMIIAFVTGTYAVLEPSLGLAISTCLISLSFFFLVYLVCRFIYKNLIS
ncbi:protein ACCELERATED CELL DEATH 6 isoform X1 [Populus trichocarpa]|uniref:protein ACCELERATED CELL DEATH 6 isoform X1 n=1 Tax=Populus trichocarpa TaxID=3694 RepID=UPI002278AF55|nr:protein ACCELERATED CELL DEATH 6 isoform X1 [Populus trichocarpa]